MKSDSMPAQGGSPSGRKSDFPKGVISPGDTSYPPIFKEVIKPALPVYFCGNASLLIESKKLAVIGSRHATDTHARALRRVLDGVHDLPLTIVSGLALGLDALAHTIALDNNLPTIAVLGSSVEEDEIYPRMNLGLAHRILMQDGLLISPFPPLTEPARWNFPIRNQFIAALSDATLVASAAKKSGALITARLALEYGKDVFVIPGSIEDPLYEGTNLLLQQGAHPILSANDILEYFEFSPAARKEYATDDPIIARIIAILKQQRCSANELAITLKLNGSEMSSLVTKLELKGWAGIGADGMLSLK